MKERRFLSWRWCPNPERMKVTRTRPSDRSWAPLVASALILSLLAVQGIQPWVPSGANIVYPNNYGVVPIAEPTAELTSPYATPEAAEPSQITSVVTTEHMNVQFSFPDSVSPGQTITVAATSTARSSTKVNSLIIEIYAYSDRQLVRAASETVIANKQVRSGNSWQSALSFMVPNSAQRSAIIGTVKETWEETTMTYYSSDPFWPYDSYGYPPYNYPPYNYPPYNYPPYNYTVYPLYPPYRNSPVYVVTEKVNQQTIPLTYVLATTPEYEALSQNHDQLQQDHDKLATEYNDLVSEHNDLVSEHNDLVSEHNSLRSEYDQTVSRYNQLQSNYESATAELDSYKTYTYVLVAIAAALGIVVIFLLLRRRQVSESPTQYQVPSSPPERKEKHQHRVQES